MKFNKFNKLKLNIKTIMIIKIINKLIQNPLPNFLDK